MLVEAYHNMQKEIYNGPSLNKYFQTKTLQRLKGIGLFCGMDYVGIKSMQPREFYSRYEHSVNIAHTAGPLSGENLTEILAGLFHDVGSLSFAHVNSFKKGEGLTQENDELNVKSVILKDEELLTYLHEDGINLDDVCDASKYPLLDKEIPALCLDRADGILATCLFWASTHSIEEIHELYYMLSYLEKLHYGGYDMHCDRLVNEKSEIIFNGELIIDENFPNVADYEDFFKAINVYSSILLTKENRYLMEVFGLVLKFYEDMNIITEADLFNFSEQEIIDRIFDSRYAQVWKDFVHITEVDYARSDDNLIIYSKPKIRQANPLVWGHMEVTEINMISGDFYRELNPLEEAISLVDKPLVSNLSKETSMILKKYKKR